MTAPMLGIAPVTFTQDPARVISCSVDGFGLTHYDSRGVRHILQATEGWRGSGPVRANRTERDGAPGSHRGTSWPAEKIIRLKGKSKAPNPAARADAEFRIGSLCPPGDDVYRLLRTDEDGVSRLMYVERDDDIDPIPAGRRWLDWTIQLAAADPRKHTPDWQAVTAASGGAGSGGVVSTGNGVVSAGAGVDSGVAPQPAVATVTGRGHQLNGLVAAITGPTGGDVYVIETSTGAQVRYAGYLGPGDVAYLNLDRQEARDVPGAAGPIPGQGALLGGDSALSAVNADRWPTLPAGQSRSFLLAGALDAATQLTMYARGVY